MVSYTWAFPDMRGNDFACYPMKYFSNTKDQGSYQKELNNKPKMLLSMVKDYLLCTVS